jgi:hypothetical protein
MWFLSHDIAFPLGFFETAFYLAAVLSKFYIGPILVNLGLFRTPFGDRPCILDSFDSYVLLNTAPSLNKERTSGFRC